MNRICLTIVASALLVLSLGAQSRIPLQQLLGDVPFILKDSSASGGGASLTFVTPDGNELWANCRPDSTVDQFIARPATAQTSDSLKNAYVALIIANAFGRDSKAGVWFTEACQKRLDRTGIERNEDIEGWSLALPFQKGAASRFIARIRKTE